MKKPLRRILYGYVIIFLAIYVGIDLLADPVGYFLIAIGCLKIAEHVKDAKVAANISWLLILLSIPSVFIDFNRVENGAWFYYSNLLFTGKIILTYYIFKMLQKLAAIYGDNDLANRTKRLFTLYISANLLMLGLMALMMGLDAESIQLVSIVLAVILVILNILFIVLLNAFRKAVSDDGSNYFNKRGE